MPRYHHTTRGRINQRNRRATKSAFSEKGYRNRVRRHPHRLRVFSEGDSWFAFPYWIRKSVINHLMEQTKINLLRHEQIGGEIKDLASGPEFAKLKKRMRRHQPDLLLLSAGGNGIIGEQFANWLNHARDLDRPRLDDVEAWINREAFDQQLERIMEDFKTIINMRDQVAPECWIFVHTYDAPFPRDAPVFFVIGPWMIDSLQERMVPESLHRRVPAWMLDRFAEALRALANSSPRVRVVETQGTLVNLSDWGDEIHPTEKGFNRIAQHFITAMREQFPGLVRPR